MPQSRDWERGQSQCGYSAPTSSRAQLVVEGSHAAEAAVISCCSRGAYDSAIDVEPLGLNRRLRCRSRICASIAEWSSTDGAFPGNGNRHRCRSEQRWPGSGERRRRCRECCLSWVGHVMGAGHRFHTYYFPSYRKRPRPEGRIAENRTGGSSSRAFVTADGLAKEIQWRAGPTFSTIVNEVNRSGIAVGQWANGGLLAGVLN